MEMMLNSALTGTGNVMRISPLFSSRLYAEERGFHRRHVGARAIGAVNGAKHRIRALADLESLLQVRRSDAPSVTSIVTTGTRPVVVPRAVEETDSSSSISG